MIDDAGMSGAPQEPAFDPPEEAEQNRRSERRLIWKGVMSALVVAAFVVVRQVFFV